MIKSFLKIQFLLNEPFTDHIQTCHHCCQPEPSYGVCVTSVQSSLSCPSLPLTARVGQNSPPTLDLPTIN